MYIVSKIKAGNETGYSAASDRFTACHMARLLAKGKTLNAVQVYDANTGEEIAYWRRDFQNKWHKEG